MFCVLQICLYIAIANDSLQYLISSFYYTKLFILSYEKLYFGGQPSANHRPVYRLAPTMTRYLTLFLLFILSSVASQAQIYESFNGRQYLLTGSGYKIHDPETGNLINLVDNYITIKYVAGASATDIQNLELQYSMLKVRENSLGWNDYQIGGYQSVGSNLINVANAIQNELLVDVVDIPFYGEYVASPNDTEYPTSWHHEQANDKDIDTDLAWDITTGSSNVVVGVLDSGTKWDHEDLGLGTDGFQNIYLNSAEDDWTDPNDPTSGNGIDDDGNGYVDDWKGYDFNNNNNDSRSFESHGTNVAGVVAAKTNNNKGVAGIAGGWNSAGSKMLICGLGDVAPNSSVIDDAIMYAADEGVYIIQLSLTALQTQAIDDAIVYAYNKGCLIICAAGNQPPGQSVQYPASHPLVFSVGATNQNDNHPANFGRFGPVLDIAAPGQDIRTTGLNDSYSTANGTSFAAPIVSGTAALMKSINPCLTPEWTKRLLMATAEKVGGYDYNWDAQRAGHSKELGHGRLNAHDAVKAAQDAGSATLDLYMRDRYNDTGLEPGYPWTWDFDDSPDIWVRNQDDGLAVHEHENPEYQVATPVYVYVRVGNKSCVASSGTEELALYWSKAATGSSWPTNWDGTDPSTGNQINKVTIPVLQPGEFTILKFTWNIFNSGLPVDSGSQWNNCLLARIENSPNDAIVVHPNQLSQDVYLNNSVAMRNCVVTNYVPGIVGGGGTGPVDPTRDRYFYVGNPYNDNASIDLLFMNPDDLVTHPVTSEAEVNIYFDETGWSIILPYLQGRDDITITGERRATINTDEVVEINDILFERNQRIPIRIVFNFLTEEVSEQTQYRYHVVQRKSESIALGDDWIGGVHFIVNRTERDDFEADAGDDRTITEGQTTTLSAQMIPEAAEYNWYDAEGNLVHTGTSLSVSPYITKKYKLEVVTLSDGYKDYDEVEVAVNKIYIASMSPNPVDNFVNISYDVQGATSAYLIIVGTNNHHTVNNYLLDVNATQATIDMSAYPAGIYTIALVIEGTIVEAKSLSVH